MTVTASKETGLGPAKGDPVTVPSTPTTFLGSVGHCSVGLNRLDQIRWWTFLSIGGLATAAILAAAGGFPFDLPMPTHAFGWVTPTCGLTRGSTAIARGDWALAWHYNPASFLVVTFGVVGCIRAVIGWTTGRWVQVGLTVRRNGWIALTLLIAVFWVYQQRNAAFIIDSAA